MNILQGIIIGIIQGLTEFLPVSSSAHLIFIQKLIGVESSLAFDTFLHLGSLLAVLIFFRKDIYKMLKAWFLSIGDILHLRFMEGFRADPYKRLAWYVILATIPVAIAGLFFESQVDALFAGALYVPGFFLLITGTILYISQRIASGKIDMSHMGWLQSLVMGLGQACAIMPGLSRSGTTIAAGLAVGLDKEFAARFSFILSIPAIFGAFIVQFKDIGLSMGADGAAVILGFLAAFISGYIAIKWLLDLIQNKSLDIFAYYCWIVGIIVFVGSIAHIF